MVLKQITEYLEENNFEINISVSDFIDEVSNIYHEIESKDYNNLHKIMFQVSSKYWDKIINNNYDCFEDNLTVLDYGCGTGFAIDKILKSSLKLKIKKIICYDLSSHMIAECEKNILNNHTNISKIDFEFLSGKDGLNKVESLNYDLIITNALLHHLLDLNSFFNFIQLNLKSKGIYIAGHEPNKNYYNNAVLIKKTKLFQKYKRVKSIFALSFVLHKLKIRKLTQTNIVKETNAILLERKIINNELPSEIIPKLVDIHVPIGLSTNQVWGEIGFDPDLILTKYLNTFKLIDVTSYFHIKDYKVYNSLHWKRIARNLKKQYPNDGADCIMLFKNN